jgi:hypothetical protein
VDNPAFKRNQAGYQTLKSLTPFHCARSVGFHDFVLHSGLRNVGTEEHAQQKINLSPLENPGTHPYYWHSLAESANGPHPMMAPELSGIDFSGE